MLALSLSFTKVVAGPDIEMSITDPNLADIFSTTMEELQNKQRKAYEDFIEATTEVSLSHRQFVKSNLGMYDTFLASSLAIEVLDYVKCEMQHFDFPSGLIKY